MGVTVESAPKEAAVGMESLTETANLEADATDAADTAGAVDPNAANDATAGEAEEIQCVICLSTVERPAAALPCGHNRFDLECLSQWVIDHHPACPLCKRRVTTLQCVTEDGTPVKIHVPAKARPAMGGAPRVPPPFVSHMRLGRTDGSHGLDLPPLLLATRVRPRRDRNRRRNRRRAPSPASFSSPAALARRARVYRLNLYSQHMGANPLSGYYHELTPFTFLQDPDLVSRARAFIRRELMVLVPDETDEGNSEGNSEGNAGSAGSLAPPNRRLSKREYLLDFVVTILQTMDTQGSEGMAENLLRDHLSRDQARLFLHELRSWLRSPYLTLDSWDRNVQYDEPEGTGGDDAPDNAADNTADNSSDHDNDDNDQDNDDHDNTGNNTIDYDVYDYGAGLRLIIQR